MDPMDVNVEAGSAARWRRLKISRFNGGSSFTWLPNFFWGFFFGLRLRLAFFLFRSRSCAGCARPRNESDRRRRSSVLQRRSLSLSLSPTVAFVFQPLRIVCSASNTMAL